MKKITLNEAIAYFNSQCPNQHSRDEKVNWISEIDGIVFENIIKDRENAPISEFTPYNSAADGSRELLVPFMFRDLYRYYIEKNVAYANREINSYNNARNMFLSCYENYFAWYNRNNKTLKTHSYNI